MRMTKEQLLDAARKAAKYLPAASSDLMNEMATRLDVTSVALSEALAQRDAVVAENHLARNAVQTFCDVVGSNTDVICEEVGEEGVRAILTAMKSTGNMPATDTILDSLRAEAKAEGVEMFASAVQGGSAISDRVIDLATDFASQLREGK